MDNKKIVLSLLLVFLVALSVSSISAADAADAVDVISADDAVDAIAVDDDAVEEIATDDSEDIVADDAAEEVLSTSISPTTNDSAGIQTALNNANVSDTIDLSVFESYDVGNTTFEVGIKNLLIKGNGSTIIKGWGGPGNGIFHVSTSGVTFQGIVFIDTNPNSVMTYYDDATKNANEIKGWGIHFQRATNCIVDNCSFINFNHGVRIQQQSNDITVKNSYFTGVTNYLRNDPLVNVEKGTKAIGIMGSQRAQLINNVFDGAVLDGISIASGSGGCAIINNTFIGNSYAIYFGGASTDATTIKGNKFRGVGEFHGTDARTGNATDWYSLPVISIQKSSIGIEISDNEIEALSGSIIIAAEAGNTAHGGPSELGNVIVTGNTITGYTPSVDVASVTLLHILSRGGEFNPNGAVTVVGNKLNGARSIVYWDSQWGSENGNATIPSGGLATAIIVVDSITNTTVEGTLIDSDGDIVDGAVLRYVIAGGANGTTSTDENGKFAVVGEAGKILSIYFDETATFAATSLNVTLPNATVVPEPVPVPVPVDLIASKISANSLSIKAGNSGTLKITLKDENDVAIADKEVVVLVDGQPLAMGNTDSNGILSVSVKYASAATKYAYISFIDTAGVYLSSLRVVKITVSKKATALSASKATLKVKKAKKLKVTLKSEGKALAKKTVSIKVNGKTFSAKTNSKGVATVSVKVTKKGNFKATVKFAGDGAYKASSKTVKYTVK